MAEYIFKSERRPFGVRFKKALLLSSLLFFLPSILTKAHNHSLQEILEICGLFSLAFSLLLFLRFRNIIDEVHIVDQKIVFIGHKFNTRWEKEYDINDAKIQIISKGNGRGNVDYYLKISCAKNTYTVNRAFTWEYKELIRLFNFFKEIRNEKVTPTEKWVLDIMDKKARGYSSLDIFIGKK